MSRLRFNKKSMWAIAENKQDALLGYFVSDITGYSIGKTISELELIASEEKTYDEIMDGYAAWTFTESVGEFVCDKDTARFISLNPLYPSLEIPLQELIDILYEWKAFIGK